MYTSIDIYMCMDIYMYIYVYMYMYVYLYLALAGVWSGCVLLGHALRHGIYTYIYVYVWNKYANVCECMHMYTYM